jgi:hypothetical protein
MAGEAHRVCESFQERSRGLDVLKLMLGGLQTVRKATTRKMRKDVNSSYASGRRRPKENAKVFEGHFKFKSLYEMKPAYDLEGARSVLDLVPARSSMQHAICEGLDGEPNREEIKLVN